MGPQIGQFRKEKTRPTTKTFQHTCQELVISVQRPANRYGYLKAIHARNKSGVQLSLRTVSQHSHTLPLPLHNDKKWLRPDTTVQIDFFLSTVTFFSNQQIYYCFCITKKVISDVCCRPLSWKQNKMVAKQLEVLRALNQPDSQSPQNFKRA